MISFVLQTISVFILFIIQKIGYAGVFFLMMLESVNIPIPSEVIMPFSGFLVSQNAFSFWPVVLIGGLGNLMGALFSYYLALSLMRNEILAKYKILRMIFHPKNIRAAENWFDKYGYSSIFFGRLAPVVRTFISFPAGLARMPIMKFSFLTLAGSLIWSTLLTWLGFILGENWAAVHSYFVKFDYLILFLILASLGVWIGHYVSNGKNQVENI